MMSRSPPAGLPAKILPPALLALLLAASASWVCAGQQSWMTLENEYFIVYYADGYSDDALKILEYANYARQVVLKLIPYELSGKVRIYLYPAPSATESGWYISYGHMSADYMRKSIYMITPSEAVRKSPYYDDAWHKKNLIHEYVHVVAGSLLYEKQGRYMGDYLPEWFSEGLAEYAAIFLSSDEAIYRKYSTSLEEIGRLVREGRGYLMVVASNIYYGGAYLVKFLVETYGKSLVMNVLTKPYPDFYTALEGETGLSLRDLEIAWLRWACNEFGASLTEKYPGIGEGVTATATITLTKEVTETLTKTVTALKTLTTTVTTPPPPATVTATITITAVSLTTVTTGVAEGAGMLEPTTLLLVLMVVVIVICLVIAATVLLMLVRRRR